MAATINGIVFHDLNHNGQYDAGEPGIPGVAVILYRNAAGCVLVQTGPDGTYSFTVTAAGTYTVYETAITPDACPPTVLGQPSGFTMSNGPRKQTLTVTAAQINNNAVIAGQSFSHDTLIAPLVCNTQMIQFVGRPTSWYNINIVTGQSILQGPLTPAHDVNAIGYNPLDNYIYGYDQTTNNLVRVDNNGALMQLLRPAGLPAESYNVGAFDLKGFLYLYINNSSRFYTVDLRPNSVTFLKLVNPAAGYAEQTANFGTALSAAANISDWGFAQDGNLYGVQRNGVLTRISPTTGQVTSLTTTGPNPDASFGALAMDSTGTIYAIANNDGTIYKYNFSGNTATGVPFSTTSFFSFNDGTMCPTAAINVDYGDAPDTGTPGPGSYPTLLANNGPRHELVNVLYLGTRVTPETDAWQNFDATGDDLNQGIADDGLTTPLPPLSVNATAYSLSVRVTNQSDKRANLYGWVDFNQNGRFESNEAAVATVPSAPGVQTIPLSFTVPSGVTLSPGQTFVRLRLTTDTLAEIPGIQDSRSVGPASDGEVEDYVLTVSSAADLAIDKTADPTMVMAGQLLTYSLKSNNAGPDLAEDVILTDAIPAAILEPEYSLDNGGSWSPWSGSLTLGDLPAGAAVTLLLRGRVDPSADGSIVNTATILSATPDPDPSNNTSTVEVPIGSLADVSVVKVGSPRPAEPGEFLVYTLAVTNAGPSDAENVNLTDAMPAELEGPEYSLNNGNSWNPWSGSFSFGTLPAGAARTVLLRGTVSAATAGTIANTAIVASTTPDPNPANNTSTYTTPVGIAADLAILKDGSPSPVPTGGLLTYTLTVTNNGPSDAQSVSLNDSLPAELSGGEYSLDNGSSWNPWSGSLTLGTIPAGQVRPILLRATVAAAAAGTIINTATVSSPTPDPNPDNNQATELTPVNTAADLAVTKAGSPNPAMPDQPLTFTVTYSNLGPDPAVNAVLTDTLAAELSGGEYSLNNGGSWSPWSGSFSFGTLNSGEAGTLLLRGSLSPNAAGILENTVRISSDTPDPDPSNNQATVRLPIGTSADLAIVKTAAFAPVKAGEVLTYTLDVTNTGPNDAFNVELTDLLPADLLNPEFSIGANPTFAPWVSPYAFGTLAAGDSFILTLRATVNPAFQGSSIVNTATVTSTTPDPDPSNNTSTVETAITTSADLAILKEGVTKPAIPGQILLYNLSVSNAGPSHAQNVFVTDALPSTLLKPEFSLDNGISYAPWQSPYVLGQLPAGTSQKILIRGTLSPSAAGTILNTAVVGSTTPDPNPANNTSTDITPIQDLADLSLIKTGSPKPAAIGGSIIYTLAVANAGPTAAQNVIVSDTLDPSFNDGQYSADGGTSWQPWNGRMALGSLGAGEARTLLLRATVTPAAPNPLSNTAFVVSDTPDPDPTNNSSTDITPLGDAADLSVGKTAQPDPATPGRLLTYTILAANAGPDAAQNVVLRELLPPELLETQYSLDGGVSWNPWSGPLNLGVLAAAESRTVLLRGTIQSGVSGYLTNQVVISSDTPDPDPTNNTSTIETAVGPLADLSVAKVSQRDALRPGQLLAYTLTVANSGPSTARNAALYDAVPDTVLENMEFSEDSGLSWSPWESPRMIGDLEAGESKTLLLRGRLSHSASGKLFNTAVVTSLTPDPDLSNNSATAETFITQGADLSLTKTSYPAPVHPCQRLVYTMTVTNHGSELAEEVVIRDELPAELGQAKVSADYGKTWYSWQGSYTVGSLAPGESFVLLLCAVVSQKAACRILNTARVTSATFDSRPENNEASLVTPVEQHP